MKEKTKDVLASLAFWLILVAVTFGWTILIRNAVIKSKNSKSSAKIIDKNIVSTFERKPLK